MNNIPSKKGVNNIKIKELPPGARFELNDVPHEIIESSKRPVVRNLATGEMSLEDGEKVVKHC